jgi:hypothetical protein
LNADAVVRWTCFIHSCTSIMAYYIFLKEHECILPTLWLVFTFFCHHHWWASSDCTLLEFHFLVHLALAILQRYFPVVFANFTHRNSLVLVPLSICINGFSINLYTVPCLMNSCHLKRSSRACSWVRLPGLTVVAIALGGFAYCNQPWWTPCHHLDGLLTNCMLLYLRAQLAGSVAISCFWRDGNVNPTGRNNKNDV